MMSLSVSTSPFAVKSHGSSHPGLQLKDRKILIATADRAKVIRLSEILAPDGYRLTDVKSGEAVLEYCAQIGPDLLLLDVELQSPDVFEVCRLIKRRHGAAGPVVVLISSQGYPEALVDGLAVGVVDFLSQPFRGQEVLARLRVHLLNRIRLVQLRKEDKAKNRLLGMAAHDLRNPLVSIRALTHLLCAESMGPVNAEQRDLLNTIYEASQSMLDLVNELLDASVIESGELKLNRTPTVLADLIQAAVKLNNATAAQKGSRILRQPGSLPDRLAIDGPKVRQVLNNLFDNALKFSPPGSIVTVTSEVTPEHCVIGVRDQGPGFQPGEETKLFKDFGRTSATPTGGEPSTGLGLSICRKIMLAHHGTIAVENIPGGGAEFRITFPLHA